MKSKNYKKYKISNDVTVQVLNYTPELLTAQFWFTGPGFGDTHHHSNQEVSVVVSGIFEATNGSDVYKVYPGQAVSVLGCDEHDMKCLTPIGHMVSTWTPARQDIIDKYTELED